jgi:hypothetical protein
VLPAVDFEPRLLMLLIAGLAFDLLTVERVAELLAELVKVVTLIHGKFDFNTIVLSSILRGH